MTGECPVPDGCDVEIKFSNGEGRITNRPENWDWNDENLTHYRKCTALNQKQEKPDLSYEASYNRLDKLVNMQAKRLNEMESELTKTLRELEAMIKRLSKEGDAITLQVALTSRNRLSEYIYALNT